MTMGEYIKHLRTGGNPYGKKLSQTELGQMLNPPVWRSAINKWEKGWVKNIKREYVEQMATIFGVTPNDIMCFSSVFDEKRIADEVKVIEQINECFGIGAVQLLQYFTSLNDSGKQKALEDIADLTEIPKYCK